MTQCFALGESVGGAGGAGGTSESGAGGDGIGGGTAECAEQALPDYRCFASSYTWTFENGLCCYTCQVICG